MLSRLAALSGKCNARCAACAEEHQAGVQDVAGKLGRKHCAPSGASAGQAPAPPPWPPSNSGLATGRGAFIFECFLS